MKLDIIFIGSGNVAAHLKPALEKAGHRIVQVFHPSKSSLKELRKDADLYIMTVKDDVITELAAGIRLKNGILVHTSGTVPLEVLKKSAPSTAVFYPLQTFSKGRKLDMKNIPFCIETLDRKTRAVLSTIAKSIGGKVQEVTAEQRLTIHLAAVFANNFSNQLYAVSEKILQKKKLSFDLLKPLILETANKAMDMAPKKAQTGPAARGDKKTMKTHLKMLRDEKDLKNIYRLISGQIRKK